MWSCICRIQVKHIARLHLEEG